MSMMWTKKGAYRPYDYALEKEIEADIFEVQAELFGKDRIYLDVKQRRGKNGKLHNYFIR